MSEQANESRTQPNPYESPKQPAKPWRFSVLTTAAICIVVVTAVSAGAFITNQAISNSRKQPLSFSSVSPLSRGPVPPSVIEQMNATAQAQNSDWTVGRVVELPTQRPANAAEPTSKPPSFSLKRGIPPGIEW